MPDSVPAASHRVIGRLAILAWIACAAFPATAQSAQDGRREKARAPDCTWVSLGSGRPLELRQLRGKVVLIDFWASWCRSCTASFPFLDAMDREFEGRGLEVVGVNLDEDPVAARDFLKDHPAAFTVAGGSNQSCAREFGVAAMPTSYLVDRAGFIREVHVGFRADDAGRLRAMVERLLDESPEGPASGDAGARR